MLFTLEYKNKDKLFDKMPFLKARANAKNAIHTFFSDEDFVEVETPQLQISPGNETHLLGFSTIWTRPDQSQKELFFATSPEFSHKKLLASGMTRIYEFARVFRNQDLSPTHAPEFTMLEWYRAGQDYKSVIKDTLEICKKAALANGSCTYRFGDKEISIDIAPEFLTLCQAFKKFANIDLAHCLDQNGNGLRKEFATLAQNAGIRVADEDDWSDIFNNVLIAKIEPELGKSAPTILYEYPLPEGALAQKCDHDKRFVERFELYICGMEIANGFGELIDSNEQRARFEKSMQKQSEIYGRAFPIDEELLEAIMHMPPTSGVALGFDRLVMLISNARSIFDTFWNEFEPGNK